MKRTIIVTALGMVIAMQSANVLAGKQIYPGSMCVRWSADDVVPTLNHSRIFNTSSIKEMRVDCPILHQNFNSTFGNNLDDADIGVINGNPNIDATCWLASRHQDGSVILGSTDSRVTSGFGNHEQNLDFGGTSRNSGNWYYIGCLIPRSHNGQQSGITYYSGED